MHFDSLDGAMLVISNRLEALLVRVHFLYFVYSVVQHRPMLKVYVAKTDWLILSLVGQFQQSQEHRELNGNVQVELQVQRLD